MNVSPLEENVKLSKSYIDFLKYEYGSKEGDRESLSFLTPAHLLFTAASTAIDLIIRAFCEPGREKIAIASPTFPLYAYSAVHQNTPVVDVPLLGENFDRLDSAKILSKNAKAIFIPSPNNPVGSVPSSEDILNLLNNPNSIFVVDEAYIEYADHPSLVPYIDRFSNLIVLRSFSKIWGLAAIRCGVVIGDPSTIYTLNKLLAPYHFPGHTQEILEDALEQYPSMLQVRSLARRDIKKLTKVLEKLAFVKKIYPTQANFILIEVSDAKGIFQELLKYGFLVKNMSHCLPNTLRISLGSTAANEKLILALQEVDKKLELLVH